MMGLRNYIWVILLCLLSLPIIGQQRPVLSQYMFSGLVINPAYAGRNEYTSFSLMHRDQWVNVAGAPKLTTVTAQSGFKDKPVGMGLIISEDQIGVHNNLSAYGSYSYVLRLNKEVKLSMGLQGGVDVLRSDWSKLNILHENDAIFGDSELNYFPNFGTGLFLFTSDFYVGLSVPYILTKRKTQVSELYRDVRHSRNYYATAGKVIDVSRKLKFKPSILMRLENDMPIAFDLNANIYYDDVIDLGCSYRQGDAAIVILGFQLNKYIKFSYAYDYILSDLTAYAKGSHELMLQYRINFSAPKHHRSCPHPSVF